MVLGLFIGSLVVLAIGLLMAVLGYYYIGVPHEEKYNSLNCSNNIFHLNNDECDDVAQEIGVAIGIIIASGIFIILGLITSIIFGVKLLMIRRKQKKLS